MSDISTTKAKLRLSKPAWLFLSLLLAISFVILLPGLNGPLLLDDNANLQLLAKFNQDQSYNYWDFLVQLRQQGLGNRPISFLSFAIQHDSWPAHIYHFKTVNLGLHYINAILVAMISFQIAQLFFRKSSKQTIYLLSFVVLTSFVWLIHPIQHSSVFYIVQRMTLLSSFFMLLGISSYLYWRPKINFSHFWPSAFFSLLMGALIIFAMLSKGNGLLLVFYILLIELILKKTPQAIPAQQSAKYLLWFRLLVLAPPVLFFIGFTIYNWSGMTAVGELREFSVWERLLTQSRVIFSYLYYIISPNVFQAGLFHDDVQVSTGIFSPISTLLSLIGILLLFIILWKNYHKANIVFFGIAWFFISHSMESTFIPLELYFEHRNYLAILGLLWIAIFFLLKALNYYRNITLLGSMAYLIIIILLAWQNANIWSNVRNITIHWAEPNIYSPRAQNYLAYYWSAQGEPIKGLTTLQRAQRHMPRELTLKISELLYSCYIGQDTSDISQKLRQDISKSKLNIAISPFVLEILRLYRDQKCINLNAETLIKILSNIASHPRITSNLKLNLHKIIGKVKAYQMNQFIDSLAAPENKN